MLKTVLDMYKFYKINVVPQAFYENDKRAHGLYRIKEDKIYIFPKAIEKSRLGPHKLEMTMLHELIHWTGHPSRMNRFPANGLAKKYSEIAIEEIIAESGAYFLGLVLGLNISTLSEQMNSYVDAWHKYCKDVPVKDIMVRGRTAAVHLYENMHGLNSFQKQMDIVLNTIELRVA